MAGYKVSYKILRQQGEDMKAAAKLVDGYSERVTQICGRLGEGEMLAEVRKNLNKLREQLGESRTVLNTAGEFLVKTVESYSGTEIRQVKKVDSTKAHSRDFYKNPVVVASAGTSAGTAAAGVVNAAAPAASSTTVNYTDNSVNIAYAAPEAAADTVQAVQPAPDIQPAPVSSSAPADEYTPAETFSAQPQQTSAGTPIAGSGVSQGAKIAAGVVGGGAVAAGGTVGGLELKKRKAQMEADAEKTALSNDYDPEAELEKALSRVRELEREEEST